MVWKLCVMFKSKSVRRSWRESTMMATGGAFSNKPQSITTNSLKSIATDVGERHLHLHKSIKSFSLLQKEKEKKRRVSEIIFKPWLFHQLYNKRLNKWGLIDHTDQIRLMSWRGAERTVRCLYLDTQTFCSLHVGHPFFLQFVKWVTPTRTDCKRVDDMRAPQM